MKNLKNVNKEMILSTEEKDLLIGGRWRWYVNGKETTKSKYKSHYKDVSGSDSKY